jgi:EAL domain-containing protein (putative c-di-GMP-specific phosphodiesterase class I)
MMKSDRTDRPAPALDHLRFLYQPVVPLDAGQAGWHEALVRWQLPDGTVRGPLDILPHWLGPSRQAAFTRFTIDQAAARLQADPSARLSVNLSPAQVTHPTAIGALEGLLGGVRGRLIVELTEQPYRDLGSLWSSLAALGERCDLVLLDDVTADDLDRRVRLHAPVDGIKLDRSVLLRLLDPDRRVVTGDLVRMAAERHEIVVAEGLEDPRHVEALDGLGVTHVQGFGIGIPVTDPAVAAVAALRMREGTAPPRPTAVAGGSPTAPDPA